MNAATASQLATSAPASAASERQTSRAPVAPAPTVALERHGRRERPATRSRSRHRESRTLRQPGQTEEDIYNKIGLN